MSKFANSLFKLRSPGRINMNMAETNYPVGHGPNGHTMVCVWGKIYMERSLLALAKWQHSEIAG